MAVASLAKVSGKQREKLEVVYDTLDKEQIREDILELMATHFSEKELNALAEFYGSPVGQSLSEKFPEYLLEANKVFQRSFFDALVKINGFKDRPDLAE